MKSIELIKNELAEFYLNEHLEKKNPQVTLAPETEPNSDVILRSEFRGASAAENKFHKHFIGNHAALGLPNTTVNILRTAAAEN